MQRRTVLLRELPKLEGGRRFEKERHKTEWDCRSRHDAREEVPVVATASPGVKFVAQLHGQQASHLEGWEGRPPARGPGRTTACFSIMTHESLWCQCGPGDKWADDDDNALGVAYIPYPLRSDRLNDSASRVSESADGDYSFQRE